MRLPDDAGDGDDDDVVLMRRIQYYTMAYQRNHDDGGDRSGDGGILHLYFVYSPFIS